MAAKFVRRSYAARAETARNPVAQDLFRLMERKQSNLAVAADVTRAEELLSIARTVGPYICVFKTHIDILDDFTPAVADALVALAKEHDFLIFEDRKFADIGNTTKLQYAGGVYRIAEWAHITNAHVVPGPGIIKGLHEGAAGRRRGLLLLAEMSSEGSLATGAYTEATIRMARSDPEFVMGFVGSRRFSDDPSDDGWIVMSPGVNLAATGDSLGQQYNSPDRVIREQGSDIIIVGRGIYASSDAVAEAKRYREAGWAAYQAALKA